MLLRRPKKNVGKEINIVKKELALVLVCLPDNTDFEWVCRVAIPIESKFLLPLVGVI